MKPSVCLSISVKKSSRKTFSNSRPILCEYDVTLMCSFSPSLIKGVLRLKRAEHENEII